MLIDTQIHPALYKEVYHDDALFKRRCDEMNFHQMKPTDLAILKQQYALAEMKHAVLLGQDCSAGKEEPLISNEDLQTIVTAAPDFFVGFASVDPRDERAPEKLVHAFEHLQLSGFTVNTAKLKMYPADPRLISLYKICRRYCKPIIFHAGLSLENHTAAKYAHPMEFEEVADDFPDIKICLAHLGWPWVNETAALLIKYPNLYANTAVMCMDSPRLLFEKIFYQDMGRYWLDHNLADKIMFGSDSPRIRPVRCKRGLDSLEMEPETRYKLYYANAAQFLGLKE